jgi:hypothetical protein
MVKLLHSQIPIDTISIHEQTNGVVLIRQTSEHSLAPVDSRFFFHRLNNSFECYFNKNRKDVQSAGNEFCFRERYGEAQT